MSMIRREWVAILGLFLFFGPSNSIKRAEGCNGHSGLFRDITPLVGNGFGLLKCCLPICSAKLDLSHHDQHEKYQLFEFSRSEHMFEAPGRDIHPWQPRGLCCSEEWWRLAQTGELRRFFIQLYCLLHDQFCQMVRKHFATLYSRLYQHLPTFSTPVLVSRRSCLGQSGIWWWSGCCKAFAPKRG